MMAKATEEEKAKRRAAMAARKADMTPEELEAFKARGREAQRRYRARWTDEQRQADSRRAQAVEERRRASLSPEERAAMFHRYHEARKQKDTYLEYRDRIRETSKRFYAAVRETALIRYSGNPAHCVCCGEQRTEFLAIDHVNGGGTQHRKNLGASNIYTWLKRNGYPDGYRTLCHNCNFAVRFGPCPHELEKVVPFERPQGGCS